ncbi:FAD-dependent oxidoreductase [Clostridium autoethanogenum]|uniref:FAD-dependent oxidoreductase n=1 Tax=Clostridium autoethanogenum DSM 10061 TaxID=1341692 RepID=A0ABN4BFA8_9CLOT|nr:FAD-dependent oxidoreductase [Clostridium autoethanogenum]AGY75258.1 FAD-dependent oxidoreductase [Clostridium autoethanogenum DSM 10061]ALU35426.1 Pyridine nucleotide-disulfide oxidoreductase [Clostridium autoethanogenum DSM 10061]OVY49495.1 Glutamate synthase [NADPH] small chain [Clostridium autoethanogenum]
MVNIIIDGKEITVPQGVSVLEAALQNGIYIPHLCHHPDLPEIESCRLCIVEVQGREGVFTSCTLKVEDGLNICTKSEKIDHLRKLAMELLLAAHPEDCSTCPKYGRCEFQTLIQYMEVSATRMRTRVKGFQSNEKNPLLIHDMNRCVLCGRCVRACNDLRGVKVLQYNKKDMETYVGTLQDKLLKDSDCCFCGACAEVCPTGTIRDMLNYSPIEKRDTLIPCEATCPVRTNIPKYLRFAKEGKFAEATAVIHEKLPFPECLGRVCAHSCESKCRRGEVNEAVSIRDIKRFAAEHDNNKLWKKNSKHLPSTGKTVCVVGGGPAGLAAAFYLAKQGHEVVLKEAYPRLGGQMQYGIPSYRLPREIVDKEANYVKEVGVKVELNTRVEKPKELLEKFDVVLMAIGTHNGVRLPMEGNELNGITVNTEFLRKASMGEDTGIGKHVIVLGGGNVAFDCARTAKRLGAEEVHLACLEKREVMLADDEEILQAGEEGIFVHPGQTFERIVGDDKVTGAAFCNVKNFYFDENRKAIIEKEPNSEHIINADTVIFAVGQRTAINEDAGLKLGRGNSIAVEIGKSAKTSVEGIFACGDAVYGTKTVIEAVASGRAAASEIDRFLGGDGDISEVLAPEEQKLSNIGRIEGFGYLRRAKEDIVQADKRKNNFNDVNKGLCNDDICSEAGRCLQCDLRFDITKHRVWSDYSISNEVEVNKNAN